MPLRRFLLVLLVAGAACSPPAPPLESHTLIDSPAGPASGEPNLAVDDAGRVHLSWLQRMSDSTHAMRFAVHDGSGWSTPATIVERTDLFVNWADFPSLHVTPGGRVLAHWLQRSGTGRYAYDVVIRQSLDAQTWGDPITLNTDGIAGEHGFLSFVDAPGDSVDAIWLDGRATVGGNDGHGGGAMQLAASRIGRDGFTPNTILDTRICDCCQTSAALTARGPVVVYRDRSDEEVRDIGIVRHVDGAWTTPTLVHADGWRIEACPVNGPSIVASGEQVAVAWFTGAQDSARVRVAFSSDAGATFGDPIRVDDGTPLGRVDIALDGRGRALVTWLERTTDSDAEVRLRAIDPRGERSDAMTIARSSAGRPAGFPRMVRTGDDLVLAWTVPGDTARVVVARGRLANP